MNISTKFITIGAEPEYRTVGKNNTPLLTLFLIENHQRFNKKTKEYETTGTSTYNAQMWGDRASEAAMELSKGDVLDLSAYEEDAKIKHRANIEENSWTDKNGNEKSKLQITIFDYEKREFAND